MELPLNALGTNAKKNYSPQPNKLDGYSHMPNRNVLPYFNNPVQVRQDSTRRYHKKKTMRFFGEAARQQMHLEDEYTDSPNVMPQIKAARGIRNSQHTNEEKPSSLQPVMSRQFARGTSRNDISLTKDSDQLNEKSQPK